MRGKIGAFLLGLSLAIAYLVGCATASYVQPQAQAQMQAPPGVQRWTYFCTEGRNTQTIQQRATQAGMDGWEMVASGAGTVGIWCFKRPM